MSKIIIFDPRGSGHCVYDDDDDDQPEQFDLLLLGPVEIRRASHVEPDPEGCWSADLSPVKGPMLGPFARRRDALRAERQWLEEHWLVGATTRR
jgi:hypothetical protein